MRGASMLLKFAWLSSIVLLFWGAIAYFLLHSSRLPHLVLSQWRWAFTRSRFLNRKLRSLLRSDISLRMRLSPFFCIAYMAVFIKGICNHLAPLRRIEAELKKQPSEIKIKPPEIIYPREPAPFYSGVFQNNHRNCVYGGDRSTSLPPADVVSALY